MKALARLHHRFKVNKKLMELHGLQREAAQAMRDYMAIMEDHDRLLNEIRMESGQQDGGQVLTTALLGRWEDMEAGVKR